MANSDPLATIKLFDGTTSKQPRLESLYNKHGFVVLSIRNVPIGNELNYVVETNPNPTEETADWEPINWDDGDVVILKTNGDAMIPACNNCVRVRIVGTGTSVAVLTLI